MFDRLLTVCHVWPGITPLNVWQLELRVWLGFADAADRYVRDMKEARRG